MERRNSAERSSVNQDGASTNRAFYRRYHSSRRRMLQNQHNQQISPTPPPITTTTTTTTTNGPNHSSVQMGSRSPSYGIQVPPASFSRHPWWFHDPHFGQFPGGNSRGFSSNNRGTPSLQVGRSRNQEGLRSSTRNPPVAPTLPNHQRERQFPPDTHHRHHLNDCRRRHDHHRHPAVEIFQTNASSSAAPTSFPREDLQVPPGTHRRHHLNDRRSRHDHHQAATTTTTTDAAAAATNSFPSDLLHRYLLAQQQFAVQPVDEEYIIEVHLQPPNSSTTQSHQQQTTDVNRDNYSSTAVVLHVVDEQFIIDVAPPNPFRLHHRRRQVGLFLPVLHDQQLQQQQQQQTSTDDNARGLPEESILKHLKTRTFVGEELQTPPEENEICPICQDEFNEGDTVGVLDCGHEYHSECIKKWLKINNECPLCKRTALST